MDMAILDLFGGSGGVGRCTCEILRQLSLEQTPIMLCGRSHVVDSVMGRAGKLEHVDFFNLELPRGDMGALKIKFLGKYASQSGWFSNALMERATRKINNGSQVIVNYPQVIPPPTGNYQFSIFVHDVNWKHYPGNFDNAANIDRWGRGWIEKASKVFVNSEFTRTDLIEQYKCNPEKVIAAPLAPFDEKITKNTSAQEDVVLGGLGLEANRYYLFPAVWGIHKGYDTLTSALEQCAETDPVVVTCGEALANIQKSTREIAQMRQSLAPRWEKLKAQRKIVVQTGVSDMQMGVLRRNCKAYVLPSHYEGFGFPLVEAVYHHRPAIVSAIPAHQEILNRYSQYKLATMFDPKSSEALAKQLHANPTAPGQLPDEWRESIKKTWSWADTVRRIRS